MLDWVSISDTFERRDRWSLIETMQMKIKSHDAAILSYIAKLSSLNRTQEIEQLIDVNISRLSKEIREVAQLIAGDEVSTNPIVQAYREWAKNSNEEQMFAR